jgi:5'(3')-deoxyribonucleotidase
MDDVLADASKEILRIINDINGLSIEKDFFKTHNFYDFIKNVSYKSYRDHLFEPGFFRNLDPLADSQKVVKELSEKHEVFIVSAAMEFPNSLREKYDWMQEHFSFISWKNLMLCGDKSVVKGDVIIDDHEKNLITFDGETLLFDAMHNQHIDGYKRVYNWKEIADLYL